MPIEIKDADGTVQKGGSVSISGWEAGGCLAFVICALIGFTSIIAGIVSLVL